MRAVSEKTSSTGSFIVAGEVRASRISWGVLTLGAGGGGAAAGVVAVSCLARVVAAGLAVRVAAETVAVLGGMEMGPGPTEVDDAGGGTSQ